MAAGIPPGTAKAGTGDITGVTAGVGISGGGDSGALDIALDLSELSAVTPTNGDSLSTLDSDGANEQLTTIASLATLFAGDGLAASSSVLGLDLVSNGGLEISSNKLQVATGISQYDVAQFAASVVDNDFLRIATTSVEGRSASEVLSDISAAPAAGDSNIVTTGALDSGSITSNFGAIDVGSSGITTTGAIAGGTIDASTDFTIGTLVITDDTIVMTPSTSDTVTIAAATNGVLNVTTVDNAAAAANINFVIDGAVDIDAAGGINLDSGSGIWTFEDSGTEMLRFTESGSGDITIKLVTNTKDLIFTDNGDATGLTIKDGAAGIVVPGEVMTTKISYTDGDDAMTIADGGGATFAQNVAIADSKFIEFESAAGTPTTDNTVQGVVIEFLAAEAITQFDAVYVSTTTGRVGRADANDAAKLPAIGIAIEAQGSAGSSVRVLTHGVYRDDGGFGSDMTVGADVYVSETPGTLTTTAPGDDGDFVQIMGVAVGVRSAFINPDMTIVEVA